MLRLLFFVLCCTLALPSFAQQSDTSAALGYIKKAQQALAQENWGAVYENYKSAAGVYEEAEAWKRYLKLSLDAALFALEVGETEVAVGDLKSIIQKSKLQQWPDSEDLALAYHKLGVASYQIRELEEAQKYFERAAKMRQKVLKNNQKETGLSYYNAAVMARIRFQYDAALDLLQKASTAADLSDEHTLQIKTNAELGYIYIDLEDFSEALKHLNLAEKQLLLLENNQLQYIRGLVFLQQGQCHLNMKNYGLALNKLRSALNLFQQTKDYLNQYATLNNIALTYLNQDQFNQASQFYIKSRNLVKEHLPQRTDLKSETLLNLAVLYKDADQFDMAQSYLNQAYKNELKFRDGNTFHPALFLIHQNLATIHYHQAQYDSALSAHQKELRCIIPQYVTQDPYTLPAVQDLGSVQNLGAALDALALKARTLRARYQSSQDAKDLRSAIAHIDLFHQAMLMARQRYSEGGALTESARSVTAYEIGIGAAVDWYKADKNKKHLATAFELAERNKSLQLLETLQNRKAESLLPQEKRQMEQAFQDSLTEQRKLLYTWRQEGVAQPQVDSLDQAIFKTQKGYEGFVEELEQAHPQYYQQKYAIRTAQLAEVQEALAPEQALIEYFLGDSTLYIFRVDKKNIQVVRKATADLNLFADVQAFRESIYDYYLGNDRSDEAFAQTAQQYSQLGHQLYQQLLAPIAQDLPQRLVLITAGPLSMLPFDALLTEQPQQIKDFKNHPYLLRQHALSQNYSATLWLEMKRNRTQKATKDFLAYAPSFGNDSYSVIRGKRYALSPLAYNATEVQNIQEILGQGKIVEGQAATEMSFRAQAPDYRILHCATHGMANDDAPDYSLLAFTEIKDSIENEFLYVSELENMELNAELVVLSACETGMGRLYRGEGIASLARGFAAAGARSLVTTLWSVSDRSTYEIISQFYELLQAGKPKDVALQQAKLQFIENGSSKLTVHPFMWAPFITIGNPAPVELESGTNWQLWGGVALGAVLLLGAGWVLRRRRG